MAQAGSWTRSKVTAATVAPFVAARLLSPGNYRIPENEEEPVPRPGEYVTFISHLERGFGTPSSLFFRRFLAFYNIKNTDLGPHSIQQLAIFVAFCESYLGCVPYFPLWLALFHGRATHEGKNGPVQACGGITFQSQSNCGFFNIALPTRAAAKWREQWLYVKEATPAGELAMPQFTVARSEPRFLRVRKLPDGQMINVLAMLGAMVDLRDKGLKTINLYACWLGRRLVPLRWRTEPMWRYTGKDFPDRQLATALSEKDFQAALQNISAVSYTSWDDGLPPYTRDSNPAPTVRIRLPTACVSIDSLCLSRQLSLYN
jgi:hypothetical protein